MKKRLVIKRIIALLFCGLLVATAVPAFESLKNRAINAAVPSSPLPTIAADWTELQKLFAPDGGAGDSFGYSISLSGDTALIGSIASNGNVFDSGSAYVFTRTGTTWTQQAKLLATDGVSWDWFGHSVSLDGDTALIGAYQDDDNGVDSGSAYVFTRTGTTWTQQAKLLASDGVAGDWFGCSVSLSGDTALIGASGVIHAADVPGSTYVFTRTGTNWTQQAKLLASDGASRDWFGYSVSLNGDTALIGAAYDDDNGDNSGSAYMFTRSNPPNPPFIDGPHWGIINVNYTFCITVTDPNGDYILSIWDWGDGTTSTASGPSGEPICTSHAWSEKGTFGIRVKLKDVNGEESGWSDPFPITIYELKKAFIFGSYTNMSSEGDFITVQAINLRVITNKQFQFLHYITGEKLTFSDHNMKAVITSRFLIGLVNVVI
jgi:hypothetical protein